MSTQSVSLGIKGPQPLRLVYSVFCRDGDPAWPFSADCCDWAEEHRTVHPVPWLLGVCCVDLIPCEPSSFGQERPAGVNEVMRAKFDAPCESLPPLTERRVAFGADE